MENRRCIKPDCDGLGKIVKSFSACAIWECEKCGQGWTTGIDPMLEEYDRVLAKTPKLGEPWEFGDAWHGDYWDTKNWLLRKNTQVAHKAIERILGSPHPVSIVTGVLGCGRKRMALTIAQVALEHKFVGGVATNLATDKFEQIVSIEKLEQWILTDTEKPKLYILAGADRHLNNSNKVSTMNRKFLDVARLARDTKDNIFLIGLERPLKEDKDGHRLSVELDDRFFSEYLLCCWIDVPGTKFQDAGRGDGLYERCPECFSACCNPAFYIERGYRGSVQTGSVWEIDSPHVQYSESDPAVFYELEPREGSKEDKGKPSEEDISSPYIEAFLRAEGAHTKAAKNMGLGADVFRRRLIQDLKKKKMLR